MDDRQLLRYSRHILLPEIGIEGQERLLAGCALVVGAGGLGCPAALYLAASGVGRIVLCDDDVVDLTNLQRQILHRSDSVGRPKVASGRDSLVSINPEVEVICVERRLGDDGLGELVAAADVVVDCSDNFHTRHAVNRACAQFARPLVSGTAIRFDGQVAVFDLRDRSKACYNCLFPEGEAADEERCALTGVFAPLTGLIGITQAAEALKLLANCGESLSGRLLLLDALTMRWREVTIDRSPSCTVCAPYSIGVSVNDR